MYKLRCWVALCQISINMQDSNKQRNIQRVAQWILYSISWEDLNRDIPGNIKLWSRQSQVTWTHSLVWAGYPVIVLSENGCAHMDFAIDSKQMQGMTFGKWYQVFLIGDDHEISLLTWIWANAVNMSLWNLYGSQTRSFPSQLIHAL